MKKFSTVKELNEMEFAQPLINSKENMMNLLVAASGNDQRVLIDIVNCLTEDQMKKCYNKLIKVYGYTGAAGQRVELKSRA
jgi:hypothetical protein